MKKMQDKIEAILEAVREAFRQDGIFNKGCNVPQNMGQDWLLRAIRFIRLG